MLPASKDTGCEFKKKKLKKLNFWNVFPSSQMAYSSATIYIPLHGFNSHLLGVLRVDASFPYSAFLLLLHYHHYYDCFLILSALWHFQGQEGFSLPLYTFLTVRDFDG